MNICVFDTETVSLEKPFCYNVGYIIYDTEADAILVKKDFVIEQVWHNPMLFSTAYYADKRPIYISAMRGKYTRMEKFGYVCQEMIRDFKSFEVSFSFAYNSPFDEKVFNFNCDWFKVINPFDNVEIKDIRAFGFHFLFDEKYKEFCEKNKFFTESGNYSTTAETAFRFLTGNIDFIEEHTALSDSEIELDILRMIIRNGADITQNFAAKKMLERKQKKTLHLRSAERNNYYFDYKKIRISKDKTEITLY